MAFNLRLTFGPQWESIPIIRNFTTDLLSAGILDINDAKKVATACSELIENVVKYSAAGGTVIDVTKDLEKGEIRLTIKNIADPVNLADFESVFDEVTSGDPRDAYKKMMLRSFSSPGVSQLGLARIRFECGGKIQYSVSNDAKALSVIPEHGTLEQGFKLLSVTVQIPVNN